VTSVYNEINMVMTMVLPVLNYSLFVEVTTNIEDYVFMSISSLNARTIGNAVEIDLANIKKNQYSSQGNSEIDRFTIDFGNVSVSYVYLLIFTHKKSLIIF